MQITGPTGKLPHASVDGVRVLSATLLPELQKRVYQLTLADQTDAYACAVCPTITTALSAIRKHITTHVVPTERYHETLRLLLKLITVDKLPAGQVAKRLNDEGHFTRSGLRWTAANVYIKFQRYASYFGLDPKLSSARTQAQAQAQLDAPAPSSSPVSPVSPELAPVPTRRTAAVAAPASDLAESLGELHDAIVRDLNALDASLRQLSEHPARLMELMAVVQRERNVIASGVTATELAELRQKAALFDEITSIARDA